MINEFKPLSSRPLLPERNKQFNEAEESGSEEEYDDDDCNDDDDPIRYDLETTRHDTPVADIIETPNRLIFENSILSKNIIMK